MLEAFHKHLRSGSTTVCRAWKVQRKDGLVLGFTDHDRDLTFDGVTFAARSGLTARALQSSTGLAVDNTEAVGALSDAAVREEDILAGRFDGAEVTAFLVNWADVEERKIQFRGTFGEISRTAGAFRVELRGLTEPLNTPRGFVFHAACSAVLGDQRCKVDLSLPDRMAEVPVRRVEQGRVLGLDADVPIAAGAFENGRVSILTGRAAGLSGHVKSDRVSQTLRWLDLWQGLTIVPEAGDMVRMVVGCDRQAATCQTRFNNFLNFRGFPHVPGEDWLRAAPRASVR